MSKYMFKVLSALFCIVQVPHAYAGVLTPSDMQVVDSILTNNEDTLVKLQAGKKELQDTLKFNKYSQVSVKFMGTLLGLGSFLGNIVPPLGVVAQAATPKLNEYFSEKSTSYTASGLRIEEVLAETDKLIAQCESIRSLGKSIIDTADAEKLTVLQDAIQDLGASFAQLNQTALTSLIEAPKAKQPRNVPVVDADETDKKDDKDDKGDKGDKEDLQAKGAL